ncbi:MAG: 30S ribosomal protein S6e [Candidatus Bilamarchaeaceae archaeon]
MKLVVSDPKTGKSVQIEVPEAKRAALYGKKIGEEVEADAFGLPGYSIKLTGGSDDSGFPMKASISGPRRMKSLVSGGTGFRPTRKGERRKKMLRGNTFSSEITQVNAIVSKAGATPLEQLFPKQEKAEEKK